MCVCSHPPLPDPPNNDRNTAEYYNTNSKQLKDINKLIFRIVMYSYRMWLVFTVHGSHSRICSVMYIGHSITVHNTTLSVKYRVLMVLARMTLYGTLLVLTGIWLATTVTSGDIVQGKGTIPLILI